MAENQNKILLDTYSKTRNNLADALIAQIKATTTRVDLLIDDAREF